MFDNTFAFDLLSRGRAAAKVGEKGEAARYLQRCLDLDPADDVRLEALYWLAEASDDPQKKRSCLEEILASNLGDARARRKLALLDGKLNAAEIVDPDHIPAPPPNAPREVAARAFLCPKCGGRRVFAPDGQTLVCEYCEANEKVARTSNSRESGDDFLVAMATAKAQRRPVSVPSIHCGGCSSVFLLPPAQISQACPYCGTAYALEQVEVCELDAPDSIISFRVEQAAARAALQAWLRKALGREQPRLAALQGIYLPVWIFALGGQVDWSGRVNKNKRWIPVSGSRVVGEENLVVPATARLDPAFNAVFGQFDLSATQPFDLRFLANWMAETFTVSAAVASLVARQLAREEISQDIRASEVSQTVDQFVLRTSNMLVTGYRLALLPVWLGSYVLEDETYPAVVNGQTGQVLAKRPARGVGGWLDRLLG